MTISDRSISKLIRLKAPGRAVSRDAVMLLRLYAEQELDRIITQALGILDRENQLRASIGERIKKRLSPKNIKMAIEGKFAGEGVNGEH